MLPLPPPYRPQPKFDLIPANHFTIQELTDIYNDTRSDYIVPMPMNVAKMQGYIDNYDIDLAHSVVAVAKGSFLGLAMLGVRGDTTWITRMGVTPKGRKKGVGHRLLQALLENSHRLNTRTVILEVIKDNDPAYRLFERFGFQATRELLVIRRPPTPVNITMTEAPYITSLDHEQTVALLNCRTDTASWVTATESMANTGKLSALVADLPHLGRGWLAYQNTPFQLSRVIMETEMGASLEVATTLLQALHQQHPLQDTSIENLEATDKHWPVFQALGYFISFVRIEMMLDVSKSKSIFANHEIPVLSALVPVSVF